MFVLRFFYGDEQRRLAPDEEQPEYRAKDQKNGTEKRAPETLALNHLLFPVIQIFYRINLQALLWNNSRFGASSGIMPVSTPGHFDPDWSGFSLFRLSPGTLRYRQGRPAEPSDSSSEAERR